MIESTAESRNEPITLLVPARERPAAARALLDAAGCPRLVTPLGAGYIVPRWVAEAAGMIEPDTPPAPPAPVEAVEGAQAVEDVEDVPARPARKNAKRGDA